MVNLAAKIMVSLKGQCGVRCDKATRFKCQGFKCLEWEQSDSITVKGIDEKVDTFQPIPDFDRLTDLIEKKKERTPLIGRASLRQALSQTIESFCRSGQASVIFLEGKAGLGKTVLVDFVEEKSQAMGVNVLRSVASELGANDPYTIFQHILYHLLGLHLCRNEKEEYDVVRSCRWT